MISVTSVDNNGDETYDVHFSGTVVNTSPGGIDVNILMYSPSTQQWSQATNLASVSGTVVKFQDGGGNNDCTFFAILEQPTTLSAGSSFETATPITSI